MTNNATVAVVIRGIIIIAGSLTYVFTIIIA